MADYLFPSEHHHNPQDALQLCHTHNTIIIVYSKKCPSCIEAAPMFAELYKRSMEEGAFDVKILEDHLNRAQIHKLNVTSYPSVLVYSPTRKGFFMYDGYRNIEDIVRFSFNLDGYKKHKTKEGQLSSQSQPYPFGRHHQTQDERQFGQYTFQDEPVSQYPFFHPQNEPVSQYPFFHPQDELGRSQTQDAFRRSQDEPSLYAQDAFRRSQDEPCAFRRSQDEPCAFRRNQDEPCPFSQRGGLAADLLHCVEKLHVYNQVDSKSRKSSRSRSRSRKNRSKSMR
jgi:hypothetical protein